MVLGRDDHRFQARRQLCGNEAVVFQVRMRVDRVQHPGAVARTARAQRLEEIDAGQAALVAVSVDAAEDRRLGLEALGVRQERDGERQALRLGGGNDLAQGGDVFLPTVVRAVRGGARHYLVQYLQRDLCGVAQIGAVDIQRLVPRGRRR